MYVSKAYKEYITRTTAFEKYDLEKYPYCKKIDFDKRTLLMLLAGFSYYRIHELPIVHYYHYNHQQNNTTLALYISWRQKLASTQALTSRTDLVKLIILRKYFFFQI